MDQLDRCDNYENRSDRGYRKPPGGATDQPGSRQHATFQRADGQDRDRRIERQHVVRQLGHHHFEHDPGRDQPCQEILRAGLPPRPPDCGSGHPRQRSPGPERHPEQQQIESRRRAVGRRRSNWRKTRHRRARRSRRTTAAPEPAATSGPRPGASAKTRLLSDQGSPARRWSARQTSGSAAP